MKKIRYCMLLLACVLFFGIGNLQEVNAASCYTVTPQITEAAEKYLTQMYIQKYPEMGLEFCYGTGTDKKVLQTLADTITKGCSTPKEMTQKIAEWTKRNIEYSSYRDGTYYYPIDVFYARKGNCAGFAQLMQHLMRLKGIKAVIGYGARGDMVTVLKTEDIMNMDGHAWVYVWYDDSWHLYDPLYDVYGEANKDVLAKWYYPYSVEGISPYYAGMDTKLMFNGYTLYYMNGKTMSYAGGKPMSQYYGTSGTGGHSVNDSISYYSQQKYLSTEGIQDGFEYLEDPGRKASMVNDECYANGWFSYGAKGMPEYLARPNGIMVANTLRKWNDKLLFMPYNGSALLVQGTEDQYTLTEGYLTVKKGGKINLRPLWEEAEKTNGRVLIWESETPDLAQIDQNGIITGLQEGLATLTVCSKDSVNGSGHYLFDDIQVYVSDGKDRVPDYTDRPVVSPEPPQPGQPPVDPDDSNPSMPEHIHTFGSWSRTKNPTALAAGTDTRTCACGAKETREVRKLTPFVRLSVTKLPLQVKKSTKALKVTKMQRGDRVDYWKSSKPKTVAVNKRTGELKAGKKSGNAVIYVKLRSGKVGKCLVTVQKGKVKTKSIKLSSKKLIIKRGKSVRLSAILNPLTSQEKVTYASSNKKVATVTSKGIIKGRKKGKTKITVKSGKKKETCTVTVR